ncbi:MAG: hypothetical protein ACYTFH_09600 [Planctomycetota bacterium]
MRTVRLVRDAVAADARDVGDLSSERAVARAIELASHLPAQRGPDVGARIAAWWSRVRSVLAECTFDESGRLAGAGLRGAATRQASYAIETGPAACEIDLEIGATDEAGRCRVWGQVHALDDSIETVGAAVAAVPAASADAVDPAAVCTVDREGFFELTVGAGRYDLAISIGDGPAALVPDLEVP